MRSRIDHAVFCSGLFECSLHRAFPGLDLEVHVAITDRLELQLRVGRRILNGITHALQHLADYGRQHQLAGPVVLNNDDRVVGFRCRGLG